jgi:Sulfotransferase family
MIYINHSKKAIFIHIPKTAGSYIGDALTKYYGFTNCLIHVNKRRKDHDELCKTELYGNKRTFNKQYDTSFFNKCIGLLEYCKTNEEFNQSCGMDEEKWNTYIKACFIRHPYDRIMSGWRHINELFSNTLPFDQYILQNPYSVSNIEYAHVFMSQKVQIQNELGQCGVDIIGRFENLEEDFIRILKKWGFTRILHTSQKINVSNHSNTGIIEYSELALNRINQIFADDFDTFHYKPVV